MSSRFLSSTVLTAVLATATVAHAAPGAPNFNAAIWGDGVLWGTKGTANLPPPNEHNMQSFDGIFVVTNENNPAEQLPVSEAAPGNPAYNGGRWALYLVTWTPDGFAHYGGIVPILTSYEEILDNEDYGYLEIESGGAYFQCPLLPVL